MFSAVLKNCGPTGGYCKQFSLTLLPIDSTAEKATTLKPVIISLPEVAYP